MLICNETQSANKNIVLSMVDKYQFKPYFYSSLPHLHISTKSEFITIIPDSPLTLLTHQPNSQIQILSCFYTLLQYNSVYSRISYKWNNRI